MKRRISIVISTMAILILAMGSAWAVTVDVNVGSPKIQKGLCEQAGNITFEFDNATTFDVGDTIQVAIASSPVWCKDVNLLVAVNDASGHASGLASGVDLTIDDMPIKSNDAEDESNDRLTRTGAGIAFKVRAINGGDTLLITAVHDIDGDGTFDTDTSGGNSSTTYTNGNDSDKLQFSLFNDEDWGGLDVNDRVDIYKKSSGSVDSGTYDTEIDVEDNAICVQAPDDFAPSFVSTGITSEDAGGSKIWDFDPATPNIAIIKTGQTFSLYDCKKSEPGSIELCTGDTSGEQEASTASNAALIINEYGTGETGVGTRDPESDSDGFDDGSISAYVAKTHRNNNLVFQTSNGNPFENIDIALELEILVAPSGSTSSDQAVAGAGGAYWRSADIETEGFNTAASISYADVATSACAQSQNDASATHTADKVYDTTGSEVSGGITQVDDLSNCDWTSTAQKITKLRIDPKNISGYDVDITEDNYLMIDLPDIQYAPEEFTAGEQIWVKATIIKMPCNTSISQYLLVGTAASEGTTTTTGSPSYLVYPYIAEVDANGMGSNFWNGYTVLNASTGATADGTYTVVVYEADGDIFTSSAMTLGPGMVTANLVRNLDVTLTTQGASGDGIFGGQRCWMRLTADFIAYGSAQITNKTAGGVHSYVIGKDNWLDPQ